MAHMNNHCLIVKVEVKHGVLTPYLVEELLGPDWRLGCILSDRSIYNLKRKTPRPPTSAWVWEQRRRDQIEKDDG